MDTKIYSVEELACITAAREMISGALDQLRKIASDHNAESVVALLDNLYAALGDGSTDDGCLSIRDWEMQVAAAIESPWN